MTRPATATAVIPDEQAARDWLERTLAPTPDQWARLERFAALLVAGSESQNLVAASTIPDLWVRHLADSAQLVPLSRDAPDGAWVDIGSGAGLPGMVVAILTDRPVVLVEPRRLRCAFLSDTTDALGLAPRVTVHQGRAQGYRPGRSAAVLSARAVAPLADLVTGANALAGAGTVWLLPKGGGGKAELASLPRAWQERFDIVPSLTQEQSVILAATGRFPAPDGA